MVNLELEKEDAEELAKALSDYKEVIMKRAYLAFMKREFNQVREVQVFIKKRIDKIHLMIMNELNK